MSTFALLFRGFSVANDGSEPEINIDIYAPGVSNSTVSGVNFSWFGRLANVVQVYNIPGPPVWPG